MPVCPLCNKPVPVPRGEQPDIKVHVGVACIRLVDCGNCVNLVTSSLDKANPSFVAVDTKLSVTLSTPHHDLCSFRSENTLIEIASLIQQLPRERYMFQE